MSPVRDFWKDLAAPVAACFRLTRKEKLFVLGVVLLFAFGLLVRVVVRHTDRPAELPAPPNPTAARTP